MRLSFRSYIKALVLFVVVCFAVDTFAQAFPTRIAFISDAHVQDVVGHPELVRSQEVQVQSTRLFNENYFALCAALDDCGQKGIRLVVLPGDLTDNGQLVNQEAVRNLLNQYAQKYGFTYFVTFGNHDPQRPFGYENTGGDFLKDNGGRTTISSKPLMDARYMPELKGASIPEQVDCYKNFGFFPKKEYRFWATPFSSYGFDKYNFDKAYKESRIDQRMYQYNDSLKAFDASYLVEPVEGIWLLSIDGNAYKPTGMKDGKQEYAGAELGYNNVLEGKHHLVDWVAKVVKEAKQRGKTLVTFCHYPLVEFNDGANDCITQAWGGSKFEIPRSPSEEVTDAFMDAGLQLHIAGHIHVNDTGIKEYDGHKLTNIQVPSTALFVPAYKILDVIDDKHFQVETVVLENVPGFDSLFPRYQKEYDYDVAHGKKPIWSIETLQSKSYPEFCDWHFRDLTRTRFIPNNVPQILRERFVDKNGTDILHQIDEHAEAIEGMNDWTGFDMILDMYRIRYAGELARRYVSNSRLEQYGVVFDAARQSKEDNEFIQQIRSLGDMFKCFLTEEPSTNFSITLE